MNYTEPIESTVAALPAEMAEQRREIAALRSTRRQHARGRYLGAILGVYLALMSGRTSAPLSTFSRRFLDVWSLCW